MVISFSFQKIGGFADEMVKSIFLLVSNIIDNANNSLLLQNFSTFYVDNQAPNVEVKNIEVDLDGQASVSISIADIEISTSDNIGISNKELSKTTFTSADIGENTIIYTVRDLVDNSTTKEVIVTVVDKSLSLDDFNLENDLQLFPNPSIEDWITISSKNNVLEKIFIFDTNGRTILEKKINVNEYKLNLQRLSSGVYFVNIKTSKEQIVKRILKK